MDRLSDDYLTSHKDGIIVVPKVQEAPAIVRFQGKYLIASSGVQEFDPTETTLVVADSVWGPYSEKQVLSEKSTWRSQITDMFYVPEGDYVMVMCDQWLIPDPDDIAKSRYLWLPLEFAPDGGHGKLHYRAEWDPLKPFT